ncbi:cysteine protease XCP2-like [Ostrinia furnacalis]|uniref:cysteine protease XCP2-like n=1 Tax=Ostrinia furnacalis TaxID=93504 RepID=UPI00103C3226|nr:cysteine protease XCP2-like [Ostrinia furnacalis]
MKTYLVIFLILTFTSFMCSVICETFPQEENVQPHDDQPKPVQIYDLNKAPELFDKFIKDYDKHYKDEEEHEKRYYIFVDNLQHINEVNSKSRSYTNDINSNADRTVQEILGSVILASLIGGGGFD